MFKSYIRGINQTFSAQCPVPPSIKNGTISPNTNSSLVEVTVQCNDGCYVEGPSSSTCQRNGTWSVDLANSSCKYGTTLPRVHVLIGYFPATLANFKKVHVRPVIKTLYQLSVIKLQLECQSQTLYFYYQLSARNLICRKRASPSGNLTQLAVHSFTVTT